MPGPLEGVRIVELAGIGPGPFCGMVLAGLGADIIRVDRPQGSSPLSLGGIDPLNRNRKSITLDLKNVAAVEVLMRLVEKSEALFEGYRPGVAERLGVGPQQCWTRNPKLVYGRVTGWGQEGPLAQAPGHDINYIALGGVLHAIGPSAHPAVPLNLVADFGGGGMLLAVGLVAGILRARQTGTGEVVDAAMVDGVSLLAALFHGGLAAGWWMDQRGVNLLDGGAPFYSVYETGDRKHVAVGALEPQFFAALLDGLDILPDEAPAQMDVSGWPMLRKRFADAFLNRTRDEWAAHFSGTEACVTPVLSLSETPAHPHLTWRRTFLDVDGVKQPAPAPRFSLSGTAAPETPSQPGYHTEEILTELGYQPADIRELRGLRAFG